MFLSQEVLDKLLLSGEFLRYMFLSQEVLEKSQLSGEFFTAFLHQNYLEFYSSIDDLVSASEYLSDADYLTTDWAVSIIGSVCSIRHSQAIF